MLEAVLLCRQSKGEGDLNGVSSILTLQELRGLRPADQALPLLSKSHSEGQYYG